MKKSVIIGIFIVCFFLSFIPFGMAVCGDSYCDTCNNQCVQDYTTSDGTTVCCDTGGFGGGSSSTFYTDILLESTSASVGGSEGTAIIYQISGGSFGAGSEYEATVTKPDGSVVTCVPRQSFAVSGGETKSVTEPCSFNYDAGGGDYTIYSWMGTVSSTFGKSTFAEDTHTVTACSSSGASCTQNSDCCSGMCEYKEDTDSYECIDSCPAEFQWDGNNPGDCVYQGAACYTSDGSQGTCTSLPEWGACTPSETACCYDTTYDGVDYGEEQGITEY